MAATAAAVVPEEDTELRDLLVQTLENSGVLNRIKAELRAAVFLALEEQEKVEGALDLSDAHSPPKSPEERTSPHTAPSKIPRYKGQGKKKTSGQKSGAKVRYCETVKEGRWTRNAAWCQAGRPFLDGSVLSKASSDASQSDTSISLSESKSKSSLHLLAHETKIGSFLSNKSLDVKDKAGHCPDGDDMEGDSFFDDPIPKPEKTYGWASEPSKQGGSLASLSDAPSFKSGLSALPGAPSSKDSESKRGNTVLKDLKLVNDKIGSLGLGTGEDDDYADDFNSTSHRSEKSELSIGEDIEEDLSVGLDDANTSDKLDDLTQDLTVSQLSDVADYLEDVAFT
ncbi:centrosomal protein 43 isoform X4 [Pteropus medius]|uniref:centrosomal protein 43 isoform X4 n=1 Tax=Pteropus vampyrus TaxID=132908 RepID=UPI00196A52D6|nr:centrosomal protein 43 isoform X4 [Pteropus giganteus]